MQTVITDAGYEKTASLLKTEYASLSGSGSFFALVRTEYDAMGNVVHDFLDVIAAATAAGYDYVNTIVYPVAEAQRCAFTDNVKYVVWLCKNHAQMSFNKDAVREKHIWKDVEWGKRAKNYNPRGKDPGNVWIPTEDDGRAHITRHIMLGDEGVVERLLAMSGCGGDYVLYREERPPAELALPPAPPRRAVGKPRSRVIFRSSENMEEIADGSVQLAVTSPPYWNLKDYFKPGQIGPGELPGLSAPHPRRLGAVLPQAVGRRLALDKHQHPRPGGQGHHHPPRLRGDVPGDRLFLQGHRHLAQVLRHPHGREKRRRSPRIRACILQKRGLFRGPRRVRPVRRL